MLEGLYALYVGRHRPRVDSHDGLFELFVQVICVPACKIRIYLIKQVGKWPNRPAATN